MSNKGCYGKYFFILSRFAEVLLLSGFFFFTYNHTPPLVYVFTTKVKQNSHWLRFKSFKRWFLKTILSEQENLFLCSFWNQKPHSYTLLFFLLKMYLFLVIVGLVLKKRAFILADERKGEICKQLQVSKEKCLVVQIFQQNKNEQKEKGGDYTM